VSLNDLESAKIAMDTEMEEITFASETVEQELVHQNTFKAPNYEYIHELEQEELRLRQRQRKVSKSATQLSKQTKRLREEIHLFEEAIDEPYYHEPYFPEPEPYFPEPEPPEEQARHREAFEALVQDHAEDLDQRTFDEVVRDRFEAATKAYYAALSEAAKEKSALKRARDELENSPDDTDIEHLYKQAKSADERYDTAVTRFEDRTNELEKSIKEYRDETARNPNWDFIPKDGYVFPRREGQNASEYIDSVEQSYKKPSKLYKRDISKEEAFTKYAQIYQSRADAREAREIHRGSYKRKVSVHNQGVFADIRADNPETIAKSNQTHIQRVETVKDMKRRIEAKREESEARREESERKKKEREERMQQYRDRMELGVNTEAKEKRKQHNRALRMELQRKKQIREEFLKRYNPI
jgi:hypothetical protein